MRVVLTERVLGSGFHRLWAGLFMECGMQSLQHENWILLPPRRRWNGTPRVSKSQLLMFHGQHISQSYRNNVVGAFMTQNATTTNPAIGPSCGTTMDFDDESDDGCTFESNGKTFVGRDSTDYYGNDMSLAQTADLTTCVQQCASTVNCKAVSYASGNCYLKSAVGDALYNTNIDGMFSTGCCCSAGLTDRLRCLSLAVTWSSTTCIPEPSPSNYMMRLE
jgi:hypothetical protein